MIKLLEEHDLLYREGIYSITFDEIRSNKKCKMLLEIDVPTTESEIFSFVKRTHDKAIFDLRKIERLDSMVSKISKKDNKDNKERKVFK